MPSGHESLLAGRNAVPLERRDVVRAVNTFLGLDPNVPVRHEPDSRTYCRTVIEGGQEYAEIIFGPDLYPGPGVVDPNSYLSVQAAAAHEVTHYHRWNDKTELKEPEFNEIDEALTSL